ncbi:hypothetical protein NEDG_01803 [Nematocida displodere]|uniref:Uncharacterized protein n=1 Tax=Nematocida displodere TaxID=1805483 RepID=A0A177EH77_9MICR|nr:hypothetical protein NEDG_01803 [Nematocida displodere]
MTVVEEKQAVMQQRDDADRRKNQKVYKFQGVRKHLDVLKECNTQMKNIQEKIAQMTERFNVRIEEFRKSTGQKELFDAQAEIQQAINTLQKEKDLLTTDLKKSGAELKTLSQSVGEEKKKLNMKSATELRNKLQAIDSRIREKPLSSKEEKEISAEKNRIIKLLSMQDIFKEKDEKIKDMEEKKRVKETELTVKKQELEVQRNKLNDVTAKIGKIKKIIYPEDVKKLQEIKATLIQEKNTVLARKNSELEVMEEKAKEYELKSVEIEKARKQKDALVEQEVVIAELIKSKEEEEGKLSANPCEQLKSLKTALSSQEALHARSPKAVLSLPMPVVGQLAQFAIAIPKKIADITAAKAQIDAIAANEEKRFEQRRQTIVQAVSTLSEQIRSEKKKLDAMPRPVFPRLFEQN